MFAQATGLGIIGLKGFLVKTECSLEKGTSQFDIVGLGDAAVQESRRRVSAALTNCGYPLEQCRVTVNLSPADVRKSGSGFDLPIMAALLAAQGVIKTDGETAFIGEVSLDGHLSAVRGVLPMAVAAAENGIKRIFVPLGNITEASVARGIEVYGVDSVNELIEALNGQLRLKPAPPFKAERYASLPSEDFAEVKGQENIKLAVEVACAGFHNMLMVGPPGSGKSMLAKRISGVLPPMSFEESIEVTAVHSVAGLLNESLPFIAHRPYRPVSHTSTTAGIIGGGTRLPLPGEISLAHNGVLFLDELPEFRRDVLESLRQPLEDGQIVLSRAGGKVTYPCQVMLIAAMNPCPCGNYGSGRKCTCSPAAIQKYLGKISQPVLDRIDIQTEVNAVKYEDISSTESGLTSAQMREHILAAREIQRRRFKGTGISFNSQIPPRLLHQYCTLDSEAEELIRSGFDAMGASARAYDRILKVARTVADLDASEIIQRRHLSRALQYRSLDKKYWRG